MSNHSLITGAEPQMTLSSSTRSESTVTYWFPWAVTMTWWLCCLCSADVRTKADV